MNQTLFQSSSSPYCKFIKKESDFLYQASLYLPEKQHQLAWMLFAFWHGLTPEQIFNSPINCLKVVQEWKAAVFFAEPFSSKLDFAQNAWMDLRYRFNENTQNYLLNFLNANEAACLPIKFPTFKDLYFLLDKMAGSKAQILIEVLQEDAFGELDADSRLAIKELSIAFTWWSFVKLSCRLIPQGKLFVPFEDLERFNCSEEDLVANLTSKNVKELTNHVLNRLQDMISFSRRTVNPSQKKLKDLLVFLSAFLQDEIKTAQATGWLLSSEEIPNQKQSKSNWFIKGMMKLPGS